MDLPDELKPDLHHTLLGPLSLATEIYGALVPGCIFTLLLLLKGRGNDLLSYPLLGYKTKLACAVLVSYVIGKVALGIVGTVGELVITRSPRREKAEEKEEPRTDGDSQQNRSVLQYLATVASDSLNAVDDDVKTFIAGVVAGPFMMGKSRAYEYYSATLTQVNFYLSTGLVILVGAAIPGDGYSLRLFEVTVAVLLLARGIRYLATMRTLVAGLMGMMLGDALTGLQPGQLARGLKIGWTIVTALSKTKVPTSSAQVTGKPQPAVPESTPTVPHQEINTTPVNTAPDSK